ncbi:MAG: hypothetical protein N3E40_07515, partial [Dehalococcoidia bacterium]|nr:hypothetical protein [Dehalococcoidia bacterium]
EKPFEVAPGLVWIEVGQVKPEVGWGYENGRFVEPPPPPVPEALPVVGPTNTDLLMAVAEFCLGRIDKERLQSVFDEVVNKWPNRSRS